jgi:hypothetical protein
MARRYPRSALVAVLALAGGAAPAAAVLGDGDARAPQARERKVIATAVSNGFRVVVTAARGAAQGDVPDTATVRIAAYTRSGGEWERLGTAITVGTPSAWFWNVVTRPYGVRRLALSRPGGEFPERVALRLLISPSIGPSATFRFHTEDGRFVQSDV